MTALSLHSSGRVGVSAHGANTTDALPGPFPGGTAPGDEVFFWNAAEPEDTAPLPTIEQNDTAPLGPPPAGSPLAPAQRKARG